MTNSGYGITAIQNRANSIMGKLHSIDDPPCIRSLRDHVETLAGVANHAMDVNARGQMPELDRIRLQHWSRLADGRPDAQTGQDQKYLYESSKYSVARIDVGDRAGSRSFKNAGQIFSGEISGHFGCRILSWRKVKKGSPQLLKAASHLATGLFSQNSSNV